jgi:pectate lyase
LGATLGCTGDYVPLGERAAVGSRAQTSCDADAPSPVQLELLASARGFGAKVDGGAAGCITHVTSLANAGTGTLRAALERDVPAWIVFDLSGDIALESDLVASSNKTLDARGQSVTLRKYGISIAGPVENVLIEGLTFDGEGDPGSQNEGHDALALGAGARRVWVDHCDLSRYGDGLVDLAHGSTDVSVSWSHFHDHDKVMLFGASIDDTEDVELRVTLHHDWFERTQTYQPRLRFGKVHSYNNLFQGWASFASGSSMAGELLSEANFYDAGASTRATLTQIADDPVPGRLRSRADVPSGGALIEENEPGLVFDPSSYYAATVVEADVELRRSLENETGPN